MCTEPRLSATARCHAHFARSPARCGGCARSPDVSLRHCLQCATLLSPACASLRLSWYYGWQYRTSCSRSPTCSVTRLMAPRGATSRCRAATCCDCGGRSPHHSTAAAGSDAACLCAHACADDVPGVLGVILHAGGGAVDDGHRAHVAHQLAPASRHTGRTQAHAQVPHVREPAGRATRVVCWGCCRVITCGRCAGADTFRRRCG